MPGKTSLPSLPAKPLSVYNFDSDLHTGTQNEEGARQGERKKKKKDLALPVIKKCISQSHAQSLKDTPPLQKKVTLVDEESHTNVKSICRAGKSETSRQRGTGCMGVVEGGEGRALQSFLEEARRRFPRVRGCCCCETPGSVWRAKQLLAEQTRFVVSVR